MLLNIIFNILITTAMLIFLLKINNCSGANKECIKAPETCPTDVIGFYFYNRDLINNPYLLDVENPTTILEAPFNPELPFKFIIHGYVGSKDNPWINDLKNEYLRKQDYNIIVADYSELANPGCYLQSLVPSVQRIGQCGADLIDLIVEMINGVKLEQFHVIGFSAGSHVAANLAVNLKSGKLERITGLDPGMTWFISVKLNKEHAKFVDVVHTNVGIIGVPFSNAHIDSFANGGVFQPGCSRFEFSGYSHMRALEYFTESITSEVGFWAYKCTPKFLRLGIFKIDKSKKILIGEDSFLSDSKDEGTYCFDTNDSTPYALGEPNEIL